MFIFCADASVRSVSSSRSSGKLSSSKKIKKPEMFMSELEKFLSHCIVKKADWTTFSDVVGQEKAKGALNEMVILPAQVPKKVFSFPNTKFFSLLNR